MPVLFGELTVRNGVELVLALFYVLVAHLSEEESYKCPIAVCTRTVRVYSVGVSSL